MFVELVGSLRCPRPHEAIWLVALAAQLQDRDIVQGELGCPTCGARYPVVDGVADFRAGGSAGAPAQPADRSPPDAAMLGERALRAAALLGLTEPGGIAALIGWWADAAHDVAALADGIQVLAIDPLQRVASGFGVSVALAAEVLPVRPMVLRAIALDAGHAVPAFLDSSAAALRPGGRLLAPAAAPLPDGITELARDAEHWVGEKTRTVQLGVAAVQR